MCTTLTGTQASMLRVQGLRRCSTAMGPRKMRWKVRHRLVASLACLHYLYSLAYNNHTPELLDTKDIDRMCGPVVFEDGTAGCAVVFLLASATDGPPGAARAIAELTRALRNAGHFTVAVITLPFEFEGQKKIEAG